MHCAEYGNDIHHPDFQIETLRVRERYTGLAESASWLYRLRFPDSGIRISAELCG